MSSSDAEYSMAKNAMRAAELGDYLARCRPVPPIADLATLDGYLAALVVGPKFIDPMRFMPEILGPDADLSLTAGTEALRVNQGSRSNTTGYRRPSVIAPGSTGRGSPGVPTAAMIRHPGATGSAGRSGHASGPGPTR